MSRREPKQLSRGKAFHKLVQDDWLATAEGDIGVEETIPLLIRPGALKCRRGRMDIYVDESDCYVSIVEIKATNWDAIQPRNIQRNLASHRRQVWKYIEKYNDGDGQDVCAGVIYPNAPKCKKLKDRIEKYLNNYGLQVVWYFD